MPPRGGAPSGRGRTLQPVEAEQPKPWQPSPFRARLDDARECTAYPIGQGAVRKCTSSRERSRCAPSPGANPRSRDERSVLPVHRHDAGAAEAEVVLERDLRVRHLALVGGAAQLPDELRALRDAGRAERMPLRQEASRWVRDDLPAVGVLLVPDELLGLALTAEAESFVGDDLVGREAVVELADLHVGRPEARLLVDLLRGIHRQVVADHLDQAPLEARFVVGGHRLAGDPHRARMPVLAREVVGAHDGRSAAACGRAALVASERVEDLFARHDLFDREAGVEERVRVVRRVLARLLADLREGLLLRPVFPPVFAPRAAEHLRGGGRLREALHVEHRLRVLGDGALAVVVLRPQRALLHLLEAEDQHALGDATLDRLLREHQRGRAGGAVVVHVEDRHPGQPDLVRRALAARAVAVDVAGVDLLHSLVRDLRVAQRQVRRLRRHHVVVLALSGLGELRHPDTDHIDSSAHRIHRFQACFQTSSLRNPSFWATRMSPMTFSFPCWYRSRAAEGSFESATRSESSRRKVVAAAASVPSRTAPAPVRSTTQLAPGLVTLNWMSAPTSFARPAFFESRIARALNSAGAFAPAFEPAFEPAPAPGVGPAFAFAPAPAGALEAAPPRSFVTASIASFGSIFCKKLSFCDAITSPPIFSFPPM